MEVREWIPQKVIYPRKFLQIHWKKFLNNFIANHEGHEYLQVIKIIKNKLKCIKTLSFLYFCWVAWRTRLGYKLKIFLWLLVPKKWLKNVLILYLAQGVRPWLSPKARLPAGLSITDWMLWPCKAVLSWHVPPLGGEARFWLLHPCIAVRLCKAYVM